MGSSTNDPLISLSRLYEGAQRLYSAVPYRLFKGGYAFPPWHYYVEITRRCNLRCKMCQYIDWLEKASPQEQQEGELSTEEWRGVIDQMHRFSLVTFTGGEPFVRKDFLELLAYAGARLRTHFISNTTMLNEERAQAVVDLAPKRLGGRGCNFAGTSIEGPGEVHDAIRRLDHAYERSMTGVRTLCRLRDAAGKQCPKVHVTTVIQAENVAVLEQMPRLLKAEGVDVWNLVTETRMFDLPDLGEVDPKGFRKNQIAWPKIEREALAEALDNALTAANDVGLDVRLPRMPREQLLDYYDGRGGIALAQFECRNAWNTMIIGRTGDFCSCWLRLAGNVREHSLKELWNNAVMREFRQACQKHLFVPCPGCCFIEHKTQRNGKR